MMMNLFISFIEIHTDVKMRYSRNVMSHLSNIFYTKLLGFKNKIKFSINEVTQSCHLVVSFGVSLVSLCLAN